MSQLDTENVKSAFLNDSKVNKNCFNLSEKKKFKYSVDNWAKITFASHVFIKSLYQSSGMQQQQQLWMAQLVYVQTAAMALAIFFH